jgi:hypothetical protein
VERHAKNLDAETTAIAFTVAQTLVDRLLTELVPIAPRDTGRKNASLKPFYCVYSPDLRFG